jgi:hypothetical protein
MDSSGSGYGPVTGSGERGNEPSRSTESGKFLEKLSDYLFLKKEPVPWC